jgi:hypothetical protein
MRRIRMMALTALAAAGCAAAPLPSDAPDVPDEALRAFDPGSNRWTIRFGYPFLAGLTDLGAEFWILFGTVGEVDTSDAEVR